MAVCELYAIIETRNGTKGIASSYTLFGRDKLNVNTLTNFSFDETNHRLFTGHWNGNTQRNTEGKEFTGTDNDYYFKVMNDPLSGIEKRRKLVVFLAQDKSTFGHDLIFDLNAYKPFTEFKITVFRVTPDQHNDYNTNTEGTNPQNRTRFQGAAVLQAVEVSFDEKLNYPQTAYGAVEFKATEFQSLPTRAYHCRGLKVKVPSNYTTREEDTKNGGAGIAQYNRAVEIDPDTIRTSTYPTFALKNDSTYRFSFESAGTTDFSHTVGNLKNMNVVGQLENYKFKNIESIYGGSEAGFIRFIHTMKAIDRSQAKTLDDGGYNGTSTLFQFAIKNIINGVPITANDFVSVAWTNRRTLETVTYTLSNFLNNNVSGINLTLTEFTTETLGNPYGEAVIELKGISSSTGSSVDFEALCPFSRVGDVYDFELELSSDKSIFPLSYQPWDGSFRGDIQLYDSTHPNYQKVYTNNPAWIYYDILTNKDYGLGSYIDEADIDKFELYQIARYCDELVPAYGGGLEPRFTCNAYLTKTVEAFKILKDLASVFRGMPIYEQGLISAVQDRPKEPVAIFTQANVIDGLFEYEYTGQRARANQINVTWNDPVQNYAQDIVSVEDSDNIIRTGKIIPKELIAFGCTSRSQAIRAGEWSLKTDTLETELIKFSTSINASHLRIGDIIKVQDQQSGLRFSYSGRLRGLKEIQTLENRALELDRPVTISSELGEKYKLHVQVMEKGVYLQQPSATINGIVYKRGDLLKENKDGIDLKTFEGSINQSSYTGNEVFESTDLFNLTDDNGQSVYIQLAQDSHVKSFDIDIENTKLISEANVVIISDTENFSNLESDLVGAIWAISKEEGNPTNDSIFRKYRISQLVYNQDLSSTAISASLYIEEKFNEIDSLKSTYYDPTDLGDYLPATLASLGYNLQNQ